MRHQILELLYFYGLSFMLNTANFQDQQEKIAFFWGWGWSGSNLDQYIYV